MCRVPQSFEPAIKQDGAHRGDAALAETYRIAFAEMSTLF